MGQIFALLTALCWAQNSIIYSYLGKKVGSDAVTHIRLWLALPIIIIVNYLFTGSLFPFDIQLRSLIYISISGFFGFFIADLFIFRAFVDIGARESLVIMTTSPIFSIVFSWIFLGENLSIVTIGGILVILSGVIWVVFEENKGETGKKEHHIRGLIFALLGALTQAIGLIFVKKGMMAGVHPVTANLIRICAGLIGLVLYSSIRGKFLKDFARLNNLKFFTLLLLAVVVGPILGIILSMFALKMAPVGVVTTLMQVSPIMLLPVDIFIFRKKVSIGAIAGTILAVLGAVILFLI